MAAPAAELKVARQILGWDPLTIARAFRLAGTPQKLAARVIDVEAGKSDISGPVQVAMETFLSGWRPTGWTDQGPGQRRTRSRCLPSRTLRHRVAALRRGMPAAPSQSETWRHHYVPQFYLKRWAGSDRKLWEFQRPHRQVIARPKFPVQTGYVENLYSVLALPDDRRDYIETVFFRRVDQDASDIFDLLELPGPVVLNKSHNDGLSRFVMSLLQRDPIRVAELQVLAQRTYTEVISQSRDLYEERRGADDPSFDEYRAAFDGPSAQILGGHLIPKLSDLPKLGAHLNGMTRRLITLVSPRHQLLTCDRPLVTYNGFGRSDAYVVLPVGPSRLLAWTNSADYMDLLEEAFRGYAAVPALNRKIVAQAARFVYATSAAPLRFVTNHWPETPSDPFPGLGEFL